MKLQRNVVLGVNAVYSGINMRNISYEEMYLTLLSCDGGITGEFHGRSQKGTSMVKQIYSVLPGDEGCFDSDDTENNTAEGCYVRSIRLPTLAELRRGEAENIHHIELLPCKVPRPPTQLVAQIAPRDYVDIYIEQHEFFKLIDDAGNEVPLECLCRRPNPSS
jgi:hypothetical protein